MSVQAKQEQKSSVRNSGAVWWNMFILPQNHLDVDSSVPQLCFTQSEDEVNGYLSCLSSVLLNPVFQDEVSPLINTLDFGHLFAQSPCVTSSSSMDGLITSESVIVRVFALCKTRWMLAEFNNSTANVSIGVAADLYRQRRNFSLMLHRRKAGRQPVCARLPDSGPFGHRRYRFNSEGRAGVCRVL